MSTTNTNIARKPRLFLVFPVVGYLSDFYDMTYKTEGLKDSFNRQDNTDNHLSSADQIIIYVDRGMTRNIEHVLQTAKERNIPVRFRTIYNKPQS